MLIRGRSGGSEKPERADPGAGVEDQRLAGGQGQLDAGGVAAVAVHLRPGCRDRTARAPDPDPHPTTSWRPVVTSRACSSSTGQKITIAPEAPLAAPTIGIALAAIRCLIPSAERTENSS